ncbi:MAG TPA: pantetheine-phosphate adenylyltransferase [Acidobacteriota bacterium]|nr:pantetheine-phosphate adenylyltransferase [Acidobacteriota bacterium]
MGESNPAYRLAIYPGTFDPITYGHLDLIDRALELFDDLVVAVAHNSTKNPLFTAEERRAMIAESLTCLKSERAPSHIETVAFHGLLADLATKRRATAILRGLRAVSDFEHEFQIALTNRALAPAVETVFLMPNAKYTFLSSTIIKDVARHGGDVSRFVPPAVLQRLTARFSQ